MDMMDSLVHPTAWNWLVLCVALVVLEIAAPGIFLLWLGIAAGAVGVVLLVLPDLSWPSQLFAFALFSIIAIVAASRFLQRFPIQTDRPQLNRRGEQYVGRVFDLEMAVENGFGKIRVDDTTWKVTGADCEVGARVKVIGVAGAVLMVERHSPLVPEGRVEQEEKKA